jgi:PAS domain S-box-containing protein
MDAKLGMVLLVTENKAEAGQYRRWLTEAKDVFSRLETVPYAEAVREKAFSLGIDLVILDLASSQPEVVSACLKLSRQFAQIPVVVVSREEDSVLAGEFLEVGVQEFLYRGQINGTLLARAIDYAKERKKVENQYRQSLIKYTALVERTRDGLAIIQDQAVCFANQAFLRLFNAATEEITGVFFSDLLAPESAEFWRQREQDQLAGREVPSLCEMTLQRRDGGRTMVELNADLTDYEGRPAEVIILRDLSKRREVSEEREQLNSTLLKRVNELTILHSISRVVAGSLDLDSLLNKALDMVAEAMVVETAAILLVDEDQGVMVVKAHRGVSLEYLEVVRGLPLGEGVTGRVTAFGKPVVIDNLSAHPRLSKIALRQEGLKSIVAVPMRARSVVVGTLVIAVHDDRVFGQEEFNLLITIGETLGLDVRNAILYEQIKEKNERLRLQNSELQLQSEELMRQKQELMEKTEELAAASKMKSQFLASMSHELRTPLNAVIGFSELMLDGVPGQINEEQRQCLNDILSSGQHLLNLINDVLDLSKVEAGKMELRIEELDLAAAVNEASGAVKPMLEANHHTLSLNMPPALPQVRADKGKLRQILLNLLSNAIKFTAPGGKLRVEAVQREGLVELAVIDNGIGIRAEDQKKIFAAFTQVDNLPDGRREGTGLGLALSKQLIEMMGGRIWVESKYGEGSRFAFNLQVAQKEAPAEGKEGRGKEDGAGKLILVIDDDRKARSLLRAWLREEGYTVKEAAGGNEGIKLAAELSPALIILDILMPDKNGWQVLEELKEDPRTAAIPVMIASVAEEQGLGFSLGAIDYFVKPIDRSKLMDKLKKLGLRRMEEASGKPATALKPELKASRPL